MSVSPTAPAQTAPRAIEASTPRTARPEGREADRDAWAANLINEMRRAARASTPGRSL